jgi:hypothetical protein
MRNGQYSSKSKYNNINISIMLLNINCGLAEFSQAISSYVERNVA